MKMRFLSLLFSKTRFTKTRNRSQHLVLVRQSDDACCTNSLSAGVNCTSERVSKWLNLGVCFKSWEVAHKFKQESVLSERSNTAGKAQDEHHPSHDDEEPHGVEASKICDGGQIWQYALKERTKENN